MKFQIIWTNKSLIDIEDIFDYLKDNTSKEIATKIIDEIYLVPEKILYAEQFQIDEFREDCKRIIVRNYKILYFFENDFIYIVSVFNTFQNPLKSLL